MVGMSRHGQVLQRRINPHSSIGVREMKRNGESVKDGRRRKRTEPVNRRKGEADRSKPKAGTANRGRGKDISVQNKH
jgi:hypothetical protein